MKLLPKMKGHTTTWGQKTNFWIFAIGMIIYYQIVGGYMNTFLLLQGVSMTKVAAIIFVVKIWDAVNDPLFAFIFDKIQFKGKRKEKCLPWLRISAILMPIASILFFNMPNAMNETQKLLWFALTYVFWDMAYTICDVPFFAMTTTMTTNSDERNFLFSWARVFHGAGTLICGAIMTLMVGEIGQQSFGTAAIVTCGLAVLCTLPLCFMGKESYAVSHIAEETPKNSFTLKQMFTYLAKNKYLTIMYACQILISAFSISNAAGLVGTYYIYGSTAFTVIANTLNMICGPVIGLILPFLLKKFDRFKLYISCMSFCFIAAVINFLAYYVGLQTVPFAIGYNLLISVPGTIYGLIAYTFTLDALEYGRYKTGIDATGINFAVQTFSAKIPGAINNALGMLLLGSTSFVLYEVSNIADLANYTQPEGAVTQMWTVLNLPALIVNALGIILLLFFYKLRSKDAELMGKCNAGEITREECEAQLSRKY